MAPVSGGEPDTGAWDIAVLPPVGDTGGIRRKLP
jgi:hypothetical protein